MGGGKSVIVDSYPDFRFPAAKVEAAITARTKMLVLTSRSNPAGVVMSQAEVQAAVERARRHDLVLLSDESYEPFLYDSVLSSQSSVLPSPAKSYEKTILLRGFSKSHAMTGWRLGYAAGPAEIIAQMTKLQQYTFVCAPSAFQYAALKALDVPMRDAVAAYRRKRDIVYDGLNLKFDLVTPAGAFYIFPQAPAR